MRITAKACIHRVDTGDVFTETIHAHYASTTLIVMAQDMEDAVQHWARSVAKGMDGVVVELDAYDERGALVFCFREYGA